MPMTDQNKIALRQQLVMGILQTERSISVEEALKRADKVYTWIMEGSKTNAEG